MSRTEIDKMGFSYVSPTAALSSKASYYGCKNIVIGDNVRIDDFCVLSAGTGGIEIGRNVHVAVYSSLIGRGKITLSDYSNISARVSIFSSSDDYSGHWMTNPTVPEDFTNVTHSDVFIGKHAIIGCGSVILPGVKVNEGVAIGALSLVKGNCRAFTIYAGVPAKKICERSKDLKNIARRYEIEG